LGPQYVKDIEFDYNFILEKLLLKFPIVNDLSDYEVENICKFLTQQNQVKWLILMELQNGEILSKAWTNASNLRVSFIGLEELFNTEMDIEIEINPLITHLDLISRKILISQLRKFLTAAPEVISIHVKLLNRHMLEFIAKNHFKLQTLFYEHIDENVAELYEELKRDAENLNRDLKLIQRSFWFNNEIPFSIDPTFWRE
jgi:hypothetical protein